MRVTSTYFAGNRQYNVPPGRLSAFLGGDAKKFAPELDAGGKFRQEQFADAGMLGEHTSGFALQLRVSEDSSKKLAAQFRLALQFAKNPLSDPRIVEFDNRKWHRVLVFSLCRNQ
jgi:hypothetical protein